MKINIETLATYEEIGLELDLTRSAVRKIEQRALRKLQKALQAKGLDFDSLLPTETPFEREDIL
jgi:DNA-directed RNA polymerase sigma subunit (sigma70/sigma32)